MSATQTQDDYTRAFRRAERRARHLTRRVIESLIQEWWLVQNDDSPARADFAAGMVDGYTEALIRGEHR